MTTTPDLSQLSGSHSSGNIGWADYVSPIKLPANNLAFSPQNHPNFDGIITQKFTSTQPYAGLYVNLAALRHYLQQHCPSHLESIAEILGQQLAKGAIDPDIAAIEGVGAQEMYQHLLNLQHHSKSLFRRNVYTWNLPPLAQTPFSSQNLSAPSSQPSASNDSRQRERTLDELVPEEMKAQSITDPQPMQDPVAASLEICEILVATSHGLKSVDTLAEIPRQESIEEARIILRWLRNLQFSDRDLEEFLDQGTPPAIVSKKEGLRKLTDIFAAHMRHMKSIDPSTVQNDAAIQNARDALDTIALEVAEHTRNLVPDGSAEESRLNQLIDSLPDSAKMRQNQSLEQLLDTMELGIARASGKTVENSSFARLLAGCENLNLAVTKIKSHKAKKEEPAREESVDMAKEILRRLKHISFGQQTLAQFAEHGQPEEKAAFVQQVGEIAHAYKNLLMEAVQSNPDLRDAPAMKEASAALTTFLYSTKLMAAKEMPVSVASSMQISADAAGNPAEWKNMQNRTVERLLESATKAMEKAVDEVVKQQAQQHDQERSEEQGQEASEQAAQQAAEGKEKHKKKRQKGDSKPRSSGKGSKKSRKVQQEMTADDYTLKQGRFAIDAQAARAETDPSVITPRKSNDSRSDKSKTNSDSKSQNTKQKNVQGVTVVKTGSAPVKSGILPPGLTGVKASDMQAIMELGDSLRNVSNQLKDIGVTAAAISSSDKIAPDNKSVAQRVIEREEQKRNPNKKDQGPGV